MVGDHRQPTRLRRKKAKGIPRKRAGEGRDDATKLLDFAEEPVAEAEADPMVAIGTAASAAPFIASAVLDNIANPIDGGL